MPLVAHRSSARFPGAPISARFWASVVCLVLFAGCDSSALYLGSDVRSDGGPGGDARDDAGRRSDAGRNGAGKKDAGPTGVGSRDAGTSARDGGGDAAAGCPDGFADCNGDDSDGCEVNLKSDVKHCGSCEMACATRGFDAFGATCNDGLCKLTCEFTMEDCDGDPSNGCESFLWFDKKNCGACGAVCDGDCQQGKCQ